MKQNNKIKSFLGVVVLGLGIASFAHAEFLPQEWLFTKNIITPEGVGKDTLIGVELDSEVFGKVKKDMGDLRIIDNNGVEVPYVLRSETTKSQTVRYSPKMYDLSFTAGDSTSFIVDFGGNVAHNEISILTSSRNFRKQVKILGSNDRISWKTLSEGKEIYDYSMEFSARDTSISYPESLYRYLQIRIDDSEEKAIKVSGVSAQRFEVTRAKKVFYQPTVIQEEKDKQTIITADVGQRGLETDSATLVISSQNFQRHVSVLSSDNNKNWSTIGSDILYSYQTSKINSSKSIINYGSIKKRYVRFVIDNYDNQPLTIENKITLEGFAHSILFLADANKTYGLYYGYENGYMPHYDFESVYQYFDENEIVRGTLDVQKPSSLFKVAEPIVVPEPVIPWTEKYQTALIAIAYSCAGGLLVFLMMNIFRRTKIPSEGRKFPNSLEG